MTRSLLDDSLLGEMRMNYIADSLWAVNRAVYQFMGGEFSVPMWSDYIDPTPKDTRGRDEIIGGLIERLTGKEVENGSNIV